MTSYESYIGNDPILPNVSYVGDVNEVFYNPLMTYSLKPYTCIEPLENGTTVNFKSADNNSNGGFKDPINTLYYSKDQINWEPMPLEGIIVNSNEKLYCKCLDPITNNTENNDMGVGTFVVDKHYNVSGNSMSLIYGDDFEDKTSLEGYNYALGCLFAEPTNISNVTGEGMLKNVSKDFLPATTLADNCYMGMFMGCTSLTTPPQLPATTLKVACYHNMFVRCTSLTTAPELPATTLASYCYSVMFWACTSLTTPPSILPATTLASYCYMGMFNGCTSLTTAPTLPATTLAENCYDSMFAGCTLLNYIKMLAIDISGSYSLNAWVYNVSPTGTFIKHPDMTTLSTGDSGIPEGWEVIDYNVAS